MPDSGQHRHLVLLELHPSTATVSEPTAGELGGDVGGGHLDTGDHALDHGDEGSAVGFSGCGPTQHAPIFPCRRRVTESAATP